MAKDVTMYMFKKRKSYKTTIIIVYVDKESLLVSDLAVKASDKYNKKLTPNTFSIIRIVEDFISSNSLICYGGIAINNILPKNKNLTS